MPEIGKYPRRLPKPPKEIVCQRCGIKFCVKGPGKAQTKYCIECKVKVYEEQHSKERQKQRRLQKATNV